MIDPLSFATGLAAGLSVSLAIVAVIDWWLSRLAREMEEALAFRDPE